MISAPYPTETLRACRCGSPPPLNQLGMSNEAKAMFAIARAIDRLAAALGNAPPSDGGKGPATHEGPSGNGLNQNPPTGDQP